jgi:nucleotide-binding universal stress UspA family protein
MRYRTILCASDGQKHSRQALHRAAELARESDAELHVVHIPEREPNLPALHATDYVEATRIEREQEIRSELDTLYDGERALMVVPHFLPEATGSVAEQITALAERLDADVIVVGSRRRGAIGTAAVGSTFERVVSQTSRPVFVFAGEAPAAPERRRSRRALRA